MFEKILMFVWSSDFWTYVFAVIGWGGLNGAAPPTYEMAIASGVLTIAAAISLGLVKMENLHGELINLKEELKEIRGEIVELDDAPLLFQS